MNKIKVLLVEDEPTLAKIIKDSLEANRFSVTVADNGVTGLEAFLQSSPDILVADVMMPRMSGFEMVQRIRQSDTRTPILFLTAKTSVDDVVEGFQAGANDYLKKPFGMKELIVRLQALLGRVEATRESAGAILAIGRYRFEPGKRLLTYLPTGESYELPNRENEILKRLCLHRDVVVSGKEILFDLWGDDDFFCTHSFQVLISRLRRKLIKDPAVKLVNVRGEGYKLVW